MRSMVIDMNDEQVHALVQMQAFLDGTVALEFALASEERYGFIARTVRRFGYGHKPAVHQEAINLMEQSGARPSHC